MDFLLKWEENRGGACEGQVLEVDMVADFSQLDGIKRNLCISSRFE